MQKIKQCSTKYGFIGFLLLLPLYLAGEVPVNPELDPGETLDYIIISRRWRNTAIYRD